VKFARCHLCLGRRPLRKVWRDGGVAYCLNEAACRATNTRDHLRGLRSTLGHHSNESGTVAWAQKRMTPHARSARRGVYGSRWQRTQAARRASA
jgi:hypothetical protein